MDRQPSPIQALVVDDEALGRERIVRLLAGRDEDWVTDLAEDGEQAVGRLQENDYDLAFLDIQMPYRTGFEVVEAVGVDAMPPTIFVTAYDEFALKAFAVHALGYLLKPFEADRFHEAVTLALERTGGDAGWSRRLQGVVDDVAKASPPLDRILVKQRGAIRFVRVEEIDWIEAAGNYIQLHAGNETHLVRHTMAGIEGRLDQSRFARIHRSAIVNLDRIRDLRPTDNGEHLVRLTTGAELTLSRSYRDLLKRFE